MCGHQTKYCIHRTIVHRAIRIVSDFDDGLPKVYIEGFQTWVATWLLPNSWLSNILPNSLIVFTTVPPSSSMDAESNPFTCTHTYTQKHALCCLFCAVYDRSNRLWDEHTGKQDHSHHCHPTVSLGRVHPALVSDS